VPASSIILLEVDPAAGEAIRTVLDGVGYAIETVTDTGALLKDAPKHSLIIIDSTPKGTTPADVCREVRGTPNLAAIPVLCMSTDDDVEERIRFLEAGADDVVAKPFDSRELEARVEALLLRFQRSRGMVAVSAIGGTLAETPRRLVAVYSPKGGVGTTTIAVNIAVAHAESRPGRVLIIDLDLQFGQVATHLNVTPRQTIADLVRDEPSQREPELLRTYVSHHPSGLDVLAAPGSPELAELVSPEHVGRVLDTALLAYDAVVVDTGSALDERSMAVLDAAEVVLVPVYPEISALRAVHAFIDYVNEAGSIAAKANFVLNNVFAKELLKMRDVESGLGARIGLSLPYDPLLYLKAVNEGEPVVLGAARTPVAAAILKLGAAAFGQPLSDPGASVSERKPRRLGGLLRRT
jgi:pilus assembly protein CpaE